MSHTDEVSRGERFRFGENWSRFLDRLTPERIAEAERSLLDYLSPADLRGRHFMDVGSGSGLFSLAARRLGAQVLSFDYDPQSVACTTELKHRFFPRDDGLDRHARVCAGSGVPGTARSGGRCLLLGSAPPYGRNVAGA